MTHPFVEKSIEIQAPAAKVWRVFVDPATTRQMGGEYVSDWQVGGAFGFKGLGGTMLTQGSILEFEPEKVLKHNLFGPDGVTILSVITYELREAEGRTTLTGREEFTTPLDEAGLADAAEGWEAALGAVKEIAEK